MGASVLSKLEKCPGCGDTIADHSVSLLASMVIDREDKRRLHAFFDALKCRRWTELLASQDWEGGEDDVELYGIRCKSDRVTLVVVRSPFELLASDEIIGVEVLTKEESRDLLALVEQEKWKAVA